MNYEKDLCVQFYHYRGAGWTAIGVLVGLLAWASTENVVLGVLTCVGVSIVGFVIIRLIEKAIGKGVDAAADAAAKAYRKHKEQNGDKK